MLRQTFACRFRTASVLLLIAIGLIIGQTRPSHADGVDITVRLSPQQAAQFHSSLAALEAQGHVTLVAEGSPLKPTLVGKITDGVPLTQKQIQMIPSDLLGPLPLGEAVERVAKAYDYSVERRPGLFLLRKQYTDPADLPGVTMEECTLALQDIHTLLAAFAPDPDGNKPVVSYATDIINNFSPEQQAILQKKADSVLAGVADKTPPTPQKPPNGLPALPIPTNPEPVLVIPIADLNPQQRTEAWQFVEYSYIQMTLDSATLALSTLKQAPQTSIGVRTLDLGDPIPYTLFGYQGPAPATFYAFREEISASDIQSRLAHPTKQQEAAILEREDATKNDGHVTLAQEAVVLGGRGLHVEVDPALRAKPITVMGEAHSPPEQIVQAMADIYGLHALKKDDGTMALTRWLVRMPNDITGLPDQMWRLVPVPLANAIHMRDEVALYNQGFAPPTLKSPTPPVSGAVHSGQPQSPSLAESDQIKAVVEAARRSRLLPNAIKQPALERLRAAIDRGPTPAQDGELISLSSLTDADQSAFAVSFLTEFLHLASKSFANPTPYCVTHFDSFLMKVTIYLDPLGSGKVMVGIALDPPDNTGGGSHDGPGIFNVPYEPGH